MSRKASAFDVLWPELLLSTEKGGRSNSYSREQEDLNRGQCEDRSGCEQRSFAFHSTGAVGNPSTERFDKWLLCRDASGGLPNTLEQAPLATLHQQLLTCSCSFFTDRAAGCCRVNHYSTRSQALWTKMKPPVFIHITCSTLPAPRGKRHAKAFGCTAVAVEARQTGGGWTKGGVGTM